MLKDKSFYKQISSLKFDLECRICGQKFDKSNTISCHIKFKHKLEPKEYYDIYVKSEDNLCACGKEKVFLSILKGYGKICSTKCSEAKTGSNNANYGNIGVLKHTEEFKIKIGNLTRGREVKAETRKLLSENGIKYVKTEEHKVNTLKHINRLNEKGFVNKGGRCKFYEECGIQVQGRYEQAFVRFYNRRRPNSILLGVDKQIVTPFGRYRPDFDLGFAFAEVKSHYTINDLQMSKINWNNKNNNKKVIIIILEEVDVNKYLSSESNRLFDMNILNTI